MANFVEITLYGSETEEAGNFALKSTVAGHSGVASISYDVERVGAKPIVTFDEKIFLNDKKLVTPKIRIGFNPLTEKQQYTDAAITFESYFSTDMIKSTFHYIWLNDYLIRPDDGGSPLADTKVMKVNIVGYELIEDDPWKQFAFELEGMEILS